MVLSTAGSRLELSSLALSCSGSLLSWVIFPDCQLFCLFRVRKSCLGWVNAAALHARSVPEGQGALGVDMSQEGTHTQAANIFCPCTVLPSSCRGVCISRPSSSSALRKEMKNKVVWNGHKPADTEETMGFISLVHCCSCIRSVRASPLLSSLQMP